MGTDFGKALKDYRKSKKLSLEEMAKMLGTTKQALSRYERGERQPKITVAAKFSEILNIPMVELAGGTEGIDESLAQRPPIVIPDSEMFVKIVKHMSPSDYETVMEIYDKTYKKMKEQGLID